MKKLAILSLFFALVLISPSLATVTSSPAEISMQITQGETEQTNFLINTNESIENITLALSGNLQRTGGNEEIDATQITLTPEIATSIAAGNTLPVIVDVAVPLGTAVGEYTGTININYFTSDSNTSSEPHVRAYRRVLEQTTVPLLVNVIGANQGIVTITSPSFGGENQERDKEISQAVTITNTGSIPLTGINLSAPGLSADYKVRFEGVPTTLGTSTSDNSAIVTMYITIPLSKDAGKETFPGALKVTSNEASATSDVSVEAENYLSIEDIKVTVTHRDGDSESEDGLDDGDEVDEKIKPGDEIEIEIEVENNNPDNIDIDDVRVEIENDGELDVSEDEKEDINEGDSEIFRFNFDIDDKADEETETLDIVVKGTDDEGAYHELKLSIDFDIEVPDEEVIINSIDISPSIVSCNRNVRIDVEIENTGSKDLDDAMVRIEVEELGIIKFDKNINIDENDEETSTFTITVPESARPGTYFVDVTGYFDSGSNDDSDFDTQEFTVQDCGTSGGADFGNGRDDYDLDDKKDDIIIDTGAGSGSGDSIVTTPTGNVITSVGRPSFFESTGYLVLLTGLVIILIVVVIFLFTTKK